MRHLFPLVSGICLLSALTSLHAEWAWVEGEDAVGSTMARRHPWYEDVKKDLLSGGDFMANFSEAKSGTADYEFTMKAAGRYDLYLRANPINSKLSYSLNGAEAVPVNFKGEVSDNTNIASDGKPDLRFLAWVKVGPVELKAGHNTLHILMDRSQASGPFHGMLDCFVVTNEPFTPRGTVKPDEVAKEEKALAAANAGWRPWQAQGQADQAGSGPINLRSLNEKFAGEQGWILAKGGHFIHEKTGAPVRFWAVNGPPHDLGADALAGATSTLARYGVNLVRLHGSMFERETGILNLAEVEQNRRIIHAAKAQGIYSHLSIYFPLWLEPKGDLPFLKGSSGKIPFASLYFNDDFQEVYRGWWKSVLTDPGEDGKRLIDEPALMSLELINEDSLFFWTFSYDRIGPEQMAILEHKFAIWAKVKYGSYEKALAAWGGAGVKQDAPGEDRLGFRPLWNMFSDRTVRDQDTAAFLMETQRKFYADTIQYIHGLGFKGMITCSNWITANDRVLGPLEKYTYTVGDFMDRHGYFGSVLKGNESSWSIREGHIFGHRSALKFEGEEPGKPQEFSHPVMDPKYNGLPSMISETTWTRPNKFRGEAPLYYAVYGALQDSDAIIHFADDGTRWEVKPRFFMQPWTLMTPTQMGQFPAAALIFRQGLVETGAVMADVKLELADVLALKGTPLVQSANLDELRAADTPGAGAKEQSAISPLIHYVGRTNVTIGEKPGATKVAPLSKFIDLKAQTVTSSTGQVKLDYSRGLLAVNAPKAKVICGNVAASGGVISQDAMELHSDMDQLYVALVPLDGLPLAESKRMLLQVMTEEKPAGFTSEPAGQGLERITNLGRDPWMIRSPRGSLRLKRAGLKVTALNDSLGGGEAAVFNPDGSISLTAAYYQLTVK